MKKSAAVVCNGERLVLSPITPKAVQQLERIASELQEGRCPLADIFASLGELLTVEVRDRLFPQYERAVCEDMVGLWMCVCDGALYQLRQHRKTYAKRLSRRVL